MKGKEKTCDLHKLQLFHVVGFTSWKKAWVSMYSEICSYCISLCAVQIYVGDQITSKLCFFTWGCVLSRQNNWARYRCRKTVYDGILSLNIWLSQYLSILNEWLKPAYGMNRVKHTNTFLVAASRLSEQLLYLKQRVAVFHTLPADNNPHALLTRELKPYTVLTKHWPKK